MESNSSKILKISGILLGIFGLVSLIYYRREKNVSSNVETQKSDGEDSRQEEKTEHDEHISALIKNDHKEAERLSFSDPDELIEYVLREVLKDKEFSSGEEFLEKVITMSSLLCENYEWFNYFPKNSSELGEILDKYGLRQQFNVQLYNKYTK